MKESQTNEGSGASCGRGTLTTIKECLEANGLFVIPASEAQSLILDFAFYPPNEVTYRDDQGDAACMLAIQASEDGEFVNIYLADAWCIRDCPHRASVLEALVQLATECRLVRFRHNPETDEVSLFVILTTTGHGFTSDSIMEGICDILMEIMRCDSVIRRAMVNGEVVPSSRPGNGTQLSPDEVDRIGDELIDRLVVEEGEKWDRIREVCAAKVNVPKEPCESMFIANAVIVQGGQMICLTRTLPADIERLMHECRGRVEASLMKEAESIGS